MSAPGYVTGRVRPGPSIPSMSQWDLPGYRSEVVSLLGERREVLRTGTGPAVLVIHEVPGVTPAVAEVGRWIAARGMTAVLPVLLGEPGRPVSLGYSAATLGRACVSRTFSVLATGRASPVTAWLRALGSLEHERCGGPGIGALGMCLTGGFALAMAVDERLVAPVLSQPSLPLPLGERRRRDPGVSPEDLAVLRRRSEDGLCVLGLRFAADTKSPAARFETLRRALGDAFLGVEIDNRGADPWGYGPHAHSVLTEDYLDTPGSPTRSARDQVLDFLADRLLV